MLSQCANSKCAKPFLRLREGRLFLVESGLQPREAAPQFVRARQQPRQPQPRVNQPELERYWMCNDCASEWTLVYDKDLGVALAPLRRPAASAAQSPAVQNSAKQTRASQNGAA
jgi:hypothetical protein